MTAGKNVTADQLGAELIRLGAVSAEQWAAALARAGGPAGLDAALDMLGRTPAPWAPPGDRTPAVTPYQRVEIDAARSAGSLAALPGTLLWNDYLILEVAGRGGMGKVYKAWDRGHRRFVAVKKMLDEFQTSTEAVKRQEREADVLTALDHPFLAKLFSREKLGPTRDNLLVMEFVSGVTLGVRVQQRHSAGKFVPWPVVVKLAADLLAVLDYLHANNPRHEIVLHRDIKPANVMVLDVPGGGFKPVLLDMGLAKVLPTDGSKPAEELTRQFQILGTPEYMPPEQWNGASEAVPMSDVYALGGTLYYALTGEPPFGSVVGGSRAQIMTTMIQRHTHGPRPDARAKRPDVPAPLADLIIKMTAVDPAARGPLSALQGAVADLLANLPPSGFQTGPLPFLPKSVPPVRLADLPPPSAPKSGRTPSPFADPKPPAGKPVRSTKPKPPEADRPTTVEPAAVKAPAPATTAETVSSSTTFGLAAVGRSLARPHRNPTGLLFVVALGVLVGVLAGWAWSGLVAAGAIGLAAYGLTAGGE